MRNICYMLTALMCGLAAMHAIAGSLLVSAILLGGALVFLIMGVRYA